MEIKIKVKTGARETKIIEQNGTNYVIALNAQPIEGEANKELLKFLKKKFKKQFRIVKGLKSKEKVLELI